MLPNSNKSNKQSEREKNFENDSFWKWNNSEWIKDNEISSVKEIAIIWWFLIINNCLIYQKLRLFSFKSIKLWKKLELRLNKISQTKYHKYHTK